MDVQLSAPQGEFFTSTAANVALVSGFGAGKSEAALIRCVATMLQYPTANQLILEPTFPLIRDIVYPKAESLLDDIGLTYKINRAENTIHIQDHGVIFCRTMEHPHRIIGFEVLDAFLDELDVLPTDKAMQVFYKARARLRMQIPGKKNQLYVTTTPEGYKATYELFKENPGKDTHLIQMSTYSNAHNLPDDYIDTLREAYPKQLIEAYIMGEFVNLVNMPVWGGYDVNLNNSDITPTDKESLTVGIDFNVGRGCAVVFVHRGDTLHAVGEIVDSYDTPDTIRAIDEMYPKNPITMIPDASGSSRKSVNATTSDIALLRQAGYDVKVNKKNPNIKDRVMAMNRMLCDGNGDRTLFVNKEACPYFSKGLTKQVYDKQGLPEKGLGKFDDITDAGSYPAAFLKPIRKTITTVMEI